MNEKQHDAAKRCGGDPSRQILMILTGFSLAFCLGAVFAGNLADLIPGLVRICLAPAQFTRDYFKLGGLGGGFLSTGVVGLMVCAFLTLTKAKCTGLTVAAYWLNVGFASWGMNPMNLWPFLLMGLVACKIRKVTPASAANGVLFGSALAPFISELMFRYPGTEAHAMTVAGLVAALVLALIIELVMPALCAHAPNFHLGYDLYSAGPAAGFLAFLVYCILYRTGGVSVPSNTDLGDGYRAYVTVFFLLVFGLCILGAYWMDRKVMDNYKKLFFSAGYKVDFTSTYGVPATLMNMGVYGLFILLYYSVIHGFTWTDAGVVFTAAKFTGATMGSIMCMYSFVAQGQTPRNVFPIMVGYALASLIPFGFAACGIVDAQNWSLTTQAILVGLCFASGLAPVSGRFGFWPGVAAGAIHAVLVMSVPLLHGGFCFYNGGFTCGIVAFLLIPVLQSFMKVKHEA